MVDGPVGGAGAGAAGAADVDVATGGGAGADVTLAGADDVAAGAGVVELVGVAGASGAGGGIWNPARAPIPSRINRMATEPPPMISTLPVSVPNHFRRHRFGRGVGVCHRFGVCVCHQLLSSQSGCRERNSESSVSRFELTAFSQVAGLFTGL